MEQHWYWNSIAINVMMWISSKPKITAHHIHCVIFTWKTDEAEGKAEDENCIEIKNLVVVWCSNHCFHNAKKKKYYVQDRFFFCLIRNHEKAVIFQCRTIMHRMLTIYPLSLIFFFFFFSIKWSFFFVLCKVIGFFCERHSQFNTYM